jgi:hypothetical protein
VLRLIVERACELDAGRAQPLPRDAVRRPAALY